MNILVIGNGFDLAHGLPTGYGNFLDFVQAFQRFNEFAETENDDYNAYFTSLKDKKIDIYKEIESHIFSNCWLKHFIDTYKGRQIEGKEGWIDFESEISLVIQNFDSTRLQLKDKISVPKSINNIKQLRNALFQLEFSPENYKKNKDQFLIDLNRLTRCLEIYLCDYINYKNCKPFREISKLNIDKVLSFNYTDTYKKLYDKLESTTVEYDFIHGKASMDNDIDSCNLVLGIDEYLTGDFMNKDNEFIQFKKFYQRIYKGTGCRYIDWLNDRRNIIRTTPRLPHPDLNIYIYGHSLDVTDADILRRLILENGAKTTIYHHSKEAMGSQIANLVKVIGEDELIKRTDGSNRTIIFQRSSTETI